MLLGKSEYDKKIEAQEEQLRSRIEAGSTIVLTRLQPPIKVWSALCAIVKRDHPEDKAFLDKEYIAANETHFKRGIAVANIEIVDRVTLLAEEINWLPPDKRGKWMKTLTTEFEEVVMREAGPRARNPIQVVRVKNIPLNGLDIATFLETQMDVLKEQRAKAEPTYQRLNMLRDELVSTLQSKEASETDKEMKKSIEAFRYGIDRAYKDQSMPSSYIECSEYIEIANRLINSAMTTKFGDFAISVPMMLTDIDYMHRHGSDAHYFKR